MTKPAQKAIDLTQLLQDCKRVILQMSIVSGACGQPVDQTVNRINEALSRPISEDLGEIKGLQRAIDFFDGNIVENDSLIRPLWEAARRYSLLRGKGEKPEPPCQRCNGTGKWGWSESPDMYDCEDCDGKP